MVLDLDLLLVQEPQDALFQLTRSLARDDLHNCRLGPHGLVDDLTQRAVDVLSAVVDVVEVELEFQEMSLGATACGRGSGSSGGMSGHRLT